MGVDVVLFFGILVGHNPAPNTAKISCELILILPVESCGTTVVVLMADEYLVALKTIKSRIVDCFNVVDLMMHRVGLGSSWSRLRAN